MDNAIIPIFEDLESEVQDVVIGFGRIKRDGERAFNMMRKNEQLLIRSMTGGFQPERSRFFQYRRKMQVRAPMLPLLLLDGARRRC
jgi:hypothetical protein